MDKQTQPTASAPLVGASSLLVIFAVLCLTVFALLGISTVRADGRLADSGRAAIVGYYEADFEAQRILSQLRQGAVPAGVTVVEEHLYTYSCPVSDTQRLLVEVRVTGSEYDILRYQVLPAAAWEADTSLPVWDGQIN